MTKVPSGTRDTFSQAGLKLACWTESARPALLEYTRRRWSSVLDAHYDAEDVLQDCLSTAWKLREDLSPLDVAALSRWMRRVIRNRVIELSRRMAVRTPMGPGATGAEANATHGEGYALDWVSDVRSLDLVEFAIQFEDANRAVASLRGLTRDEHKCMVLHDVIGIPWCDVAVALKRSVAGAKMLRQRARARLGQGATTLND